MTEFTRTLGSNESRESEALKRLTELTQLPDDNWWKDLLRVWVPAGFGGKNPVRLAVRDDYLNFYLRGQSIARVGFGRDRRPFAETHIKFASPNDKERRRKYVRLDEGGFSLSSARIPDWSYEAGTTVERWIERASKRGTPKKGIAEKTYVDEVVAQNGRVIDLEMGLPAWSGRATALRMDLVALESTAGRLRIVFYEAKKISDKRLVSTKSPEVLQQLQDYRKYLADPDHANRVKCAYRRNCCILLKLHDLAKKIHPKIEPLNSLIVDAAQSNASELDVCLEPRLAIFDDRYGKRSGSWPCHEDKLRASLGNRFKVFEHDEYLLW